MDLTDMSHLASLAGLEQLTLANNPCINQPEDERKQFDYRPFVINWCLSLRVLDGILEVRIQHQVFEIRLVIKRFLDAI